MKNLPKIMELKLKKLIKINSEIIIIGRPNNPTGKYLIDEKILKKLVSSNKKISPPESLIIGK
jgi:histidinol-phosphate/aromatic aminotransferase/cobyric acid decarboxylase-like protein